MSARAGAAISVKKPAIALATFLMTAAMSAARYISPKINFATLADNPVLNVCPNKSRFVYQQYP